MPFDRPVRNGSYRDFQRYLWKNCDRTFNHKTGTIFLHSKIALQRWLFSTYALLWFKTNLRQLQYKIEVTHKTVTPPSISSGWSKLTECTSLPGRKAGKWDSWSRSRGLLTRECRSYSGDKPLVFIIAVRGTRQQYVTRRKPQTNRRFDPCWPTASRNPSLSIPTASTLTTGYTSTPARATEDSPKTS